MSVSTFAVAASDFCSVLARRRLLAVLLGCCCAAQAGPAAARKWTDVSGKYSIEAELIAFDDDTVIFQRPDHQLGEIALDKLSEADRKYLESQEAAELSGKVTGAMQTWKMADGMNVEGRIVDFIQRDVTIQHRRGKLFVNDRRYNNLPEIYQKIVNKIVAHFEGVEVNDRKELNRWVARQNGKPRTFNCQGVVLELANGDEYAVPFFLFSKEDLALLQPGYADWKTSQSDYEAHQDAAMRLQALAAARMRDQQVDRQVAQMQLAMSAVTAGITSFWEVTLYPGRGTPGRSIWVVVPGRNSRDAVNAALSRNPGYTAGPVRKVSY